MRKLGVLPCVVMLGCRGLLGIEDPLVGDGGSTDGKPECTGGDYDGDGTADGCDPCPMYADPAADLDTDDDGVGDGCDPRPHERGDTRVLWTHFASANDIAGWIPSGGTWVVSGGKLQQTDGAATARLTAPETYSDVHIATEIEVASRGTSPYAGACTHVSPSAFKCCDVREETVGVVELMAWNPIAMRVIDWAGGFQPGTTFELTSTALIGAHQCFVRRQTLETDVPLTSNEPAGKIILHTRAAAVAYRYLFVVQIPSQ